MHLQGHTNQFDYTWFFVQIIIYYCHNNTIDNKNQNKHISTTDNKHNIIGIMMTHT